MFSLKEKDILVCGPLSMVTGQSKVTQLALDQFREGEFRRVYCVDNSNRSSLCSRLASNFLVLTKLVFLRFVKRWHKGDVVYFTPSRSVAGSITDFLLLFLYGRKSSALVVGHLHGADMKNFLNSGRYGGVLSGMYSRYLDRMILLSPSHAGFALDKSYDRYVVISNPCSFEVESRKVVDKSKGITEFFFASVPIESKGLDESLKFVNEFAREVKERVHIRIAGWSTADYLREYKQDFTALVDADNLSVTFMGMLAKSEMKRWMARSDVFVFLTRYPSEAQPLVVIEALKSGCPVVLSNHNFLKDFAVYQGVIYGDEDKAAQRLTYLLGKSEIMSVVSEKVSIDFSLDVFKRQILLAVSDA